MSHAKKRRRKDITRDSLSLLITLEDSSETEFIAQRTCTMRVDVFQFEDGASNLQQPPLRIAPSGSNLKKFI